MRSIVDTNSDENNGDLLTQLRRVVRHANRADIRSVPALVSKMIGNQNASLMCLRLLYWFPKSRKPGGWVYKSWRDWNAECNLSQGQVKRVHSQGYLEFVGISRKIMKANGTPTTHYRLDVNHFIACLADFLNVSEQQVHVWMGETLLETGQNVPSESADTHQSNGSTQPNSTCRNAPSHEVKATQSITTIQTQIDQQSSSKQKQQHSADAVVANQHTDGLERLFQVLHGHGIDNQRAQQIVSQYGFKRVREVADKASGQHIRHPAGFVIRALEHGWQVTGIGQSSILSDLGKDGQRYIQGKYADFIQH